MPPDELVVLTVDQLRQVLREELARLTTASAPASELMTGDEVAELLGFKPTYINELVRRHGLPACQPSGRGGKRMFRRAAVEAWAARRESR